MAERLRFADELVRRDAALKPVADALRDPGQNADFRVADALLEALDTLDSETRSTAFRVIREWAVSQEHGFDAAAFGPEVLPKNDVAVAAIRSWREWLSRFAGSSTWDPDGRCWRTTQR